VRTETPVCKFGAKAPDFSLPGTDSRTWTRDGCAGERGLLVMFICNHCPFVKAVLERIIRDTRELKTLGIGSVGIMSNDTLEFPEDSFENMQRVAEGKGFPFPYLLDESQHIARAYGAVCTPDYFGYNAELGLQYRGRIDASGMQAAPVNAKRELFEAMQQVAETGAGPATQIPSVGCSIKWRS
ncbi:MAG: thioredoxin family protein, partial [Gammaproteobacteria bacterium]